MILKHTISASKVILVLLVTILNINCSSSKRLHKLPVQEQSTLQYTTPYFQEWIAPIKIGTSGVNIYIPNLTTGSNTVIDSVYFRDMKGKLKKGRATYKSLLTRVAIDDRPETAKTFPFDLLKNECVVSYIEKGETKYFLISNITEREGIYYEKGVPNDI